MFGKRFCCGFVIFVSLVLLPSFCAHADEHSIVLFPVAIYSDQSRDYLRPGIRSMLTSRLAEAGLRVIEPDNGSMELTEPEKKGTITQQRATEVARALGAQFAVYGSITVIGKGYSLDLNMVDLAKTPPKLTHISEATTEDNFIPKLAQIANRFRDIAAGRYPTLTASAPRQRPGGPQAEAPQGLFMALGEGAAASPQPSGLFVPVKRYATLQPTGSFPIHQEIVSFDAGDLTGDGSTELAVISRKELRIYVADGPYYQSRAKLRASLGKEFIKISVGDVDGDGKAEIYLVTRSGARASTTVYDWTGKFKKRFSRAGHLCVFRQYGSRSTKLLYTPSETRQFYGNTIYLMGYDGKGKLRQIGALPNLKGVHFYSLALYDLNKDGTPEYIGLGEEGRLHLWNSSGEILWYERMSIEGTNNYVRVGDVRAGEELPIIPIDSRTVVTDIDGNGKVEAVAVHNIPVVGHLEYFKVYRKSKLIGYIIEKSSLVRGFQTREIPYCIVDLQVVNHRLFLAGQKGRISNVGKGYGRIMWFDLPKK